MPALETPPAVNISFVGSQVKTGGYNFDYEAIAITFNEDGTIKGWFKYATQNGTMNKPQCLIENGTYTDKGNISFSYILHFVDKTYAKYNFKGKLSGSVYAPEDLKISGTYERDDKSSNGTWSIYPKDLGLKFD